MKKAKVTTKKAKFIVSFAQKGGVGKTTTLQNIAYLIGQNNKKVLLIDADSQMNLTASMFGYSDSIIYDTGAYNQWAETIKPYLSLKDIWDDARERLQDPSSPFGQKKPYPSPEYPNVHLVLGSSELSLLEQSLYQQASSIDPFATSVVPYIEQELRRIGEAGGYDYVLVDTSPSANSLMNGLFVFMSDYFFSIMTPTFYCLQAVHNLYSIFTTWRDYLDRLNKNKIKLSMQPKFIGIVVNIAKRANENFSKDAKTWGNTVNQGAQNSINALKQRDYALTEDDFKLYFTEYQPYIMGMLPHFTDKIKGVSEKLGKPVLALTDEEIPKTESYADTFGMYRTNLTKIVEGILRLP